MSPLTLAFLPLLILTVATGYGLARRRFNAHRLPWKPSGVENAVIGVYALLLSFAFYMSGNASRETTTLVHEHSDALAMLYREAALLPERDAEAVRDHVQRILALEVRSMGLDGDARRSVRAELHERYAALWSDLSARASRMPPARMRPVLDFAQRAIALDYRIAYAESSGRTPQLVMVIVVSGALLVGFLVGFTNGFNEEHHLLVPFIYVILTGLAVSAILDLNDPFHGLLRPDTSNYGDLLEGILTERGAASRP